MDRTPTEKRKKIESDRLKEVLEKQHQPAYRSCGYTANWDPPICGVGIKSGILLYCNTCPDRLCRNPFVFDEDFVGRTKIIGKIQYVDPLYEEKRQEAKDQEEEEEEKKDTIKSSVSIPTSSSSSSSSKLSPSTMTLVTRFHNKPFQSPMRNNNK